MRNIFRKLTSRGTITTSEANAKVYPEDYELLCNQSIELLRNAKGNVEKISESDAEELFIDSIQWINSGIEVDLGSFLGLIQAIRDHMPPEYWLEGNPFSVHFDLYSEGIKNHEFFLDKRSHGFVFELICMGEDGQHLACCLIQDFGTQLSLELIRKILSHFIDEKIIYECEHLHETVISGHPFIELIRCDLLDEEQLRAVFNFSQNLNNRDFEHLRTLIRLYLAKSKKMPSECLEQLTKDSGATWGWIDMDGNVKTEYEAIADSAMLTLLHKND